MLSSAGSLGVTLRRMSAALRTQCVSTFSSCGEGALPASAATFMRCILSACTCAAPARACTGNPGKWIFCW